LREPVRNRLAQSRHRSPARTAKTLIEQSGWERFGQSGTGNSACGRGLRESQSEFREVASVDVRHAFAALGGAGVVLGAALGLVHALFAGSALVNVLLPVVHPRMGTGFDAAGATPLLEPPGFMLVNYGRQTLVAMIVAHLLYGAIVGGFAGWAG
jgi:hypothetical protein